MNRRETIVAGAATVVLVGSVSTAYLGTDWIRALAAAVGMPPEPWAAVGASVGNLTVPRLGAGQAPRLSASSTPNAASATTPSQAASRAVLTEITLDPAASINVRTLLDTLDTMPVATALTTDERNDLQWMRIEENLARDVFLAFFLKFGKGPFASIAASEVTHGDAVLQLLRRYGIADPAPGPEGSSVTDPTFGAMYRELVTTGLKSYVDALRIGALIEERDLRDIRERVSTRADIDAVYRQLDERSRVNLRTLVVALKREGVTWVPSQLKPIEYAAIMEGPFVGSAN